MKPVLPALACSALCGPGGYGCDVIAPSQMPERPAASRVKTDGRDSLALAECSRAGQLRAVWVPEPGDEAIRDLTRGHARTASTAAPRRASSSRAWPRGARQRCTGGAAIRERIKPETRIHLLGFAKADSIREFAEAAKADRTLQKLLDAYVAHLKTQGRRSHVDADQIFKRHVTEAWPAIVDAPAVDLTPDQVLDMLRRLIEAGKGRTANKLRS